MKVTLLAGGVGGAKLAEGFAGISGVDLTIIGNVGDDEEFHGLWVSPDIDTLTYTLAGMIDRNQGWGVADEGHRALGTLRSLGQDTWMTLGDKDLGLHIYRTMRRQRGDRPSVIAHDVARAFGVTAGIVLPTDDTLQTRVRTASGWCSFQEYFVRDGCGPEVMGLDYAGAEAAVATPEAITALEEAEIIVVAPSNPLVSIAPILAVPGVAQAFDEAQAPKIAVSPIIAGAALKGPAADMLRSLGGRADVVGVAQHYGALIDCLLIDGTDAPQKEEAAATGQDVIVTDIVMRNAAEKRRLARTVMDLAVRAA